MIPTPINDSRGDSATVVATSHVANATNTIGVSGYPHTRYGRGRSGALVRSRADVSLAISGIAGPAGGSPEKPIGTVCFAWAVRGNGTSTQQVRFEGDRDAVRRQAVARALRGVLDVLPRG